MNEDFTQLLTEILDKMNTYEIELTTLITTEMSINNYVSFYKLLNDYVFVDELGNIIPAEAEIQQLCDMYYDQIKRNDLSINL